MPWVCSCPGILLPRFCLVEAFALSCFFCFFSFYRGFVLIAELLYRGVVLAPRPCFSAPTLLNLSNFGAIHPTVTLGNTGGHQSLGLVQPSDGNLATDRPTAPPEQPGPNSPTRKILSEVVPAASSENTTLSSFPAWNAASHHPSSTRALPPFRCGWPGVSLSLRYHRCLSMGSKIAPIQLCDTQGTAFAPHPPFRCGWLDASLGLCCLTTARQGTQKGTDAVV